MYTGKIIIFRFRSYFYMCMRCELALQPVMAHKAFSSSLLSFCFDVGVFWGGKVDCHYKSCNVREGLWTCCSAHAWVCGLVPTLVTKGRSLLPPALECFCM